MGFRFVKSDGCNIVLTGPAGTGKSILALQMAITAKVGGMRLNILYLTKDTPPKTLVEYIVSEFRPFGLAKETCKPRGPLKKMKLIPQDTGCRTREITKQLINRLTRSCVWDPDPERTKRANRLPTIIFLDYLVANAYALFKENASRGIRRVLAERVKRRPVFAVADLNLAAIGPAEFPRSMFNGPLLTVLSGTHAKVCDSRDNLRNTIAGQSDT